MNEEMRESWEWEWNGLGIHGFCIYYDDIQRTRLRDMQVMVYGLGE